MRNLNELKEIERASIVKFLDNADEKLYTMDTLERDIFAKFDLALLNIDEYEINKDYFEACKFYGIGEKGDFELYKSCIYSYLIGLNAK